GLASSQHFAAELFSMLAGVRMQHVPYRRSGPAVNDLIAGHVLLMFGSMQDLMPVIRPGLVRSLGLAAAQRSPAAPDMPTLIEAGLAGMEA
uniref:Bug family tripartite tricarboxylate transporter substrate binding protein n=1 Tax=Stenotrophomonas maltophilia TaxID=40324 RepID=UPI0023B83598